MLALPYVYRLTHKETGQIYIGYREANQVPAYQDLPIYRTSSNIIKEIGFENFNWEIIAELPDGDVFIGENLTIFCRDHQLCQASMSAVCRGKYKQYKGWIGEYLNV